MEPIKIKVPEGTKEIQIEEVNGQIVTSFIPEKKHEFKNGDFITSKYGIGSSISILNGDYKGKTNVFLAKTTINRIKRLDVKVEIGTVITRTDTPSTEEEKQQLLDAMHNQGLDWDAEKMEVVPYVWTPKVGEVYYFPIISGKNPYSAEEEYRDDDTSLIRINSNRAFRTKELCDACLNEIIDILKSAKHF